MAEVATAPKTASVADKKAEEPKKKIFGVQKSPDLIVYRLIKKNDKTMRMDTPDYPPYKRFPNTDIITWEDGTREIRWLPGEQSIFVDEQEKNGRRIPDNIIHNPNNRIEIIDGLIKVAPHQKAKIKFLDMCNRNEESEYRTGTVEALFTRYTEEKRIGELQEKQSAQKKAIQKAFEATDEQVYAHARILNIPLINNLTNGSRDYEAIVADYRQTAMDNPIEFLKVFDNEINGKPTGN